MRRTILTALVPVLSLVALSGAAAQTATKTAQPFGDLVRAGFKVVSAFLIPGEINANKSPTVTVTLTKETSVAVCVVGLGDYQTIGSAKWTDEASRCDIRKF